MFTNTHQIRILSIFRNLMLLFSLAIYSATGFPEVHSVNVTIIDGDIARAKEDAVREILHDIGLTGDVELRSATALVNQELIQSSLATASFRFKSFNIIEELVVGDRLKLSVRIERELRPPSNCEPVIWSKNVALTLSTAPNMTLAGDARRGIQIFFDQLRESLESSHGGIISRGDGGQYPIYNLQGHFDPVTKEGINEYQLIFRILGVDGTVLKEAKFAVDPNNLLEKKKEYTGYANLVRWVISSEASRLISQISNELPAALRCLPVVVRVPEHGPGGSIRIDTIPGYVIKKPSIIFYSSSFPVKTDGLIDLLLLKGSLNLQSIELGSINLELPKKIAGRPFPAPGHFLLLQ